MKFLAILALFAAAVAAVPIDVNADVDADIDLGCDASGPQDNSRRNICPGGLYTEPQCCSTGLLRLASLDCRGPEGDLNDSVDTFRSLCRNKSRRAKCCVLPVAGQALLCQDV